MVTGYWRDQDIYLIKKHWCLYCTRSELWSQIGGDPDKSIWFPLMQGENVDWKNTRSSDSTGWRSPRLKIQEVNLEEVASNLRREGQVSLSQENMDTSTCWGVVEGWVMRTPGTGRPGYRVWRPAKVRRQWWAASHFTVHPTAIRERKQRGGTNGRAAS